MIPVSLRLQNFLSYGSDTDALDFTQFDVACLSGANGQGKSALLDGITWVLWGQARKSSHSRKPDAELLRIGTYEMRVEFVFDVEGERYRAERLFAQSASGKTSKSGLEVSIQDGADWRTLTGTTQAETQTRLDEIIGVDFDTFVNASFLLQGRSDEFTRRRPEERKEVLARILNLGRYEALGARAADHEREARAEAERLEEHLQRFEAIIAEVPALEAEHREVTARYDVLAAQRATLDAQIEAATQQVMRLEAGQEQAADLDRAIARCDVALAEVETEIVGLRERIARADAILAERDAILADAQRYESLRTEQVGLQERALQDRDLERRLFALRRDIEARQADHRQQQEKLGLEQRLLREQIEAMTAELRQRPELERQATGARAAAEELRRLNALLQRREALRQQVQTLERQIEKERVARDTEASSLARRIDEARRSLPDVDVLDRDETRFSESLDRFAAMRDEYKAVEDSGRKAGEEVNRLEERGRALQEQRAKIEAQLQRLADLETSSCPTCGTTLTDEHRRHVRGDLQKELRTVEAEQAGSADEATALRAERDRLRARYLELREALKGETEARAAKTRIEEQRKVRELRLAEVRGWMEDHLRVRRELEAQSFLLPQRQELALAQQSLGEIVVDEARVEEVRGQAARLTSLEEALARLTTVAATLAERQQRLSAVEAALAAGAEAEASGTLLGTLPDELQRAEAERAALGFDAARLSAVQSDLQTLQDLPRRRAELDSAREHHAEWTEQHRTREASAASQRDERARLVARREALAGIAAQLAEARQQRQSLDAERGRVAQQASEVQHQLGGLAERLRAAGAARSERDAARANLLTSRDRVALYRHLRTAFSKKGIPSLIIEETIPEIEERANLLLERLTEGRMRVRLDTIRDKKTGGTAETLGISISDEMGVVRAYETFSGGEAFRVNFALRIALSQLLAERSGTRIRTLVIDEGFGTQDAAGVQRLIEAINAVREDFDKILVVTHLDGLKNAFPTRIEVHKDPVTGSQYEVVTN